MGPGRVERAGEGWRGCNGARPGAGGMVGHGRLAGRGKAAAGGTRRLCPPGVGRGVCAEQRAGLGGVAVTGGTEQRSATCCCGLRVFLNPAMLRGSTGGASAVANPTFPHQTLQH